jgi:hypothetical protein
MTRVFSVEPRSLVDTRFWTLLQWCNDRGARTFTFGITRTLSAPDPELEALLTQVLEPYLLGEVRRPVTDTFLWRICNRTRIWLLTSESANLVRSTLLQFERENELPRAEPWFPKTPAWVSHFCAYRRKTPMLALFDYPPTMRAYIEDEDVDGLLGLGFRCREVDPEGRMPLRAARFQRKEEVPIG